MWKTGYWSEWAKASKWQSGWPIYYFMRITIGSHQMPIVGEGCQESWCCCF